MRNGATCSVFNCLNRKQDSKKSFFRLPKDKERCTEWIRRINRPDLEEILKTKGSDYLNKIYVVCSDHFTNDDFRNKNVLSQGLYQSAVPTVFENCGPATYNGWKLSYDDIQIKEEIIIDDYGHVETNSDLAVLNNVNNEEEETRLFHSTEECSYIAKEKIPPKLVSSPPVFINGKKDEKLNAIPVVVLNSDLNERLLNGKDSAGPVGNRLKRDRSAIGNDIYATKRIKVPKNKTVNRSNKNDTHNVKIVSSKTENPIPDPNNLLSLSASQLCRVCGRYGDENLVPLFGDLAKENGIAEKIEQYLPIMILKEEQKLPNSICHMCVSHLIDWHRLVSRCEKVDLWLNTIFKVEETVRHSEVKDQSDVQDHSRTSDNVTTEVVNDNAISSTDFDHDYCTVNTTQISDDNIDASHADIRNPETDNDALDDPNCSSSYPDVEMNNVEDTDEIAVDPLQQSTADEAALHVNKSRAKTKYKIFSVCVCDKEKESIVDEDSSNVLNGCGKENVETSETVDLDDKSDESGSVNVSLSDASNTTGAVVPPRLPSFDRYIARQRYKVGVTLVKRNKHQLIKECQSPFGRRNVINIKYVKLVDITVTKQKKLNYNQIMKTFKYSRQTYSRLSIFTCEHCIFYHMTASEFGKHMKSFHPDKPLICPTCKKVFKEDYNLIIHLQVTSCCKMLGRNSGECDDDNDENVDDVREDECCNESDLNVAFKLYPVTNEDVEESENVYNNFRIQYVKCKCNFKDKPYKESLFHELTVESWKPSTPYVIFEPGIVILDSIHYFDNELYSIILAEIEKLLKMEVLSLFDCNALQMIMSTKVSKILKTIDNNKIIKIKSVISRTTGEGEQTEIIAPIACNDVFIGQKTPTKRVFKPIRKLTRGRPSLKELYSISSRMKLNSTKKDVWPKMEFYLKTKVRSCDDCNRKFHCYRTFTKHKKMFHTAAKCEHCNVEFPSLKLLKMHQKELIRGQDKVFVCDICHLHFDKKDSLQKHNLLIHNIGDYILCEMCDKKFASKMNYYCHKKNVHNNEVNLCSYCGQTYKTPAALRCHIRDKHLDTKRSFQCSTCKKVFKSNPKLRAHMVRHSDRRDLFPCPVCKKMFYSKDTVKQHQELHLTEPTVYCAVCGMGYYRSSRLPVHLKSVHWTSVNKTASEQFPCLICNVMLEDCESLSQHMMFHSDDEKIKELEGNEDGKVKCWKCSKFLLTKKDVALHQFYIHKDLPFECLYVKNCGEKFWSKAALDEHEIKKHNRLINACTECSEVFRSLKKKQIHMRRVHNEGSKIHTCLKCNKTFRSAYTLDRHSVTHSDLKQFSCDRCGRCFSLPQILAKHMLWHKRQEEKLKDENVVTVTINTDDDMLRMRAGAEDVFEEDYDNDVLVNEAHDVVESQEMDVIDNSELIIPHQNIQGVEIVDNSQIVMGEVFSVCTVYKCTECDAILNSKPEFDTHYKEKHDSSSESIPDSYNPSEVLEISMVNSSVYE